MEAVFTIPARAVSAMPAITRWIEANVKDPVLIGPDGESAQWVRELAHRLSVPWLTLEKTRRGDHEVSVTPPAPALLAGRSPVIIDDIASSGRTIIETLMALRRVHAAPASCIVVHALLAPEAESAIRREGAARFVSTNTVQHVTNEIDVVPLLVAPIHELLRV